MLYEHIGARVARLDYLIALGTHPPMPAEAVNRLVGVSAEDRAERYPKVNIFNQVWDRADALTTIGSISAPEVETLTGGLLCEPIPVTLNRMILDYDQLLVCGPVFPHEVVGFSGGAKYLFPVERQDPVGGLVGSDAQVGVGVVVAKRQRLGLSAEGHAEPGVLD